MTSAAQFALRRIMEKYAKNARFCLICNYVSKIIPALQSRCTRFKFRQIPAEDSKRRVREICLAENIVITDGAIDAVLKLCEGDMRRVVNMLQSISISLYNYQMLDNVDTTVTEEFIYQMTGNPPPSVLKEIMEILLNEDLIMAIQRIQILKTERGISLQTIIKELNMMLMNVSIPEGMKIFVVRRLAEIEYRLSLNCNEKIQLGSLCGGFQEIRQIVQQLTVVVFFPLCQICLLYTSPSPRDGLLSRMPSSA
eukprot:TRINITY_DN5865_c0_g1_i9.p2 TRINITY_DN5865_c0_g1~~TRINITY_DN5865_c0_g1_i9.p2  ORF type:complete len:253 (-),score=48.68 TRINITY_DN5865_c0_g1_i9:60-818(-)